MKTLNPRALLLDFDGVVLESVAIKTDAFRELFKAYPRHVKAIVDHHLKNGGVNRYKKFEHIYRSILRRPLTAETKRKLAARFASIVRRKVLKCRPVPGAYKLLRALQDRIPVSVASATPAKELTGIVRLRGLRPYLAHVFGHPISKRQAIRKVLRRYGLQRSELLFVGDSAADWQAARAEGVPFVARQNPDLLERFPRRLRKVHDMQGLLSCIASTRLIKLKR